jgi:hypothetical protein
MQLDQNQRAKVAEWIGQGLKLFEIQNLLASELGLKMTYMETRLLVDDLKLTPKDAEAAARTPEIGKGAQTANTDPAPEVAEEPETAQAPGSVSVSVDQLTRPGALVSGKVTFSDGNRAEWYLDETGRLGLMTQKQGYRPPASDLQQFQAALQQELSKLGF